MVCNFEQILLKFRGFEKKIKWKFSKASKNFRKILDKLSKMKNVRNFEKICGKFHKNLSKSRIKFRANFFLKRENIEKV